MPKIKILRIIARLNIGGPAIHVILLTEGLNKDRFESPLVCGKISMREGDMSYYAKEKNVRPIFIPQLKREINLLDDIIAFKKIYGIIKTEKPDIIHTHTAKAGTLGRLAGIAYNFLNRNKKIKLIHTFHGHIFDGYFNRFQTKVFIFCEQILAFFTCKIITVSESIKRDLLLLGIGDENKLEVISLGFELERFMGIPLESKPVSNIGIIGRLVPIKNHRLFLEAAVKVIRDNPQLKLGFKIVGDGELRPELESYSRQLNINSKVFFLGWQSNLKAVYSDLGVVALTSINEGTPVSLIEAMASGRVVVATNVGGVEDLLGDEMSGYAKAEVGFKILERGILVNFIDARSFANALTFIIKDAGLRQDIATRARTFIKDKFSNHRLVQEIEDLYMSLIPTQNL